MTRTGKVQILRIFISCVEFPNNKPRITSDLKKQLNMKKKDLREGNGALLKAVRERGNVQKEAEKKAQAEQCER